MPAGYAGPSALLQFIRQQIPEITLVGDSTQPVYAGALGFEAAQPGRWFNSATGYGTLGYALPAAIGARLATDQPVLGIIGDGGIQFSLPELMTAVDHQIPAIILIWNNQGYGEIRSYMAQRQLPQIDVNIAAPDFKLMAQGFGAAYQYIDTAPALQNALQTAAQATGPTVLEIDETADFIDELGQDYEPFA